MLMVVDIKLREILEKRGHSGKPYRQLAQEIGISHVPLWKMLNGEPYNPSLEMLDKICTFLRCQPGDILRRRR
ncbi:Cro/C1-type HTH DNA-binding domain protein [uncultured archaeon]|nr:Cro/C1-type HTH DNA-binding domain protein [uncultured archaeon]